MKFTKFKKVLFSVVSAVLCIAMVLSVPASAAEKKSVWSETKALTSAKYNSNYIKWAEKYSAKEAKNTIAFGKSRTKKFYESQLESFDAKDPKFVVNIIDKENILSIACKGKKIKTVEYINGEGTGIYIDNKNMTLLSVGDKVRITMPLTKEFAYDELNEMMGEVLAFDNNKYMTDVLGVTDKTKGKLFKFTSNEKTYYYEEFEGSKAGRFGYLFDSKGNTLATVNGEGTAVCVSISFSVKDSEFNIPKEYKDIPLD
ncbi:MAG: hypothetical protein K2N60_12015 [Oscillospiraceae bacterium]|nr:hypothetical protein [Oscillospiraceae bacterium]